MIILSILFLGLLLFCPQIALDGSKYGASLWLTQLLPTLLPFFIAIRLFDSCLPQVSCRRFFLLTGILCGCPAGASLVTNQYDKGLLSRGKAFFYLGFVNNPSPVFVLVFCGTVILELSTWESFLLFVVMVLSSVLGSLAFLCITAIPGTPLHSYSSFRRTTSTSEKMIQVPSEQESISSRIDQIILDSFIVLAKIGGYVIIFSILGQFMSHLPESRPGFSVLYSGLLEITSGISYLKAVPLTIHAKKALMLAILTFGGLSAAAQTSSILSRSELSILPYLLIKTINSLLAWFLLYIF